LLFSKKTKALTNNSKTQKSQNYFHFYRLMTQHNQKKKKRALKKVLPNELATLSSDFDASQLNELCFNTAGFFLRGSMGWWMLQLGAVVLIELLLLLSLEVLVL